MSQLISLVKRDIKIYNRTKGNIFYALLSVMILIGLHFLVFRSMYIGNWEQFAPAFATHEHLAWIVDNLMFSAIIPIGAVTISLVSLGLIVADREKNVLSDFMVAPIKRNTLLASYLLSSFLIGIMSLLGFVVLFEAYFLIAYGVGFSLIQFALILLACMASLVFANIFMLLLISLLKSQQSLGAVGTILGTMLGFINGAYFPVSMFGEFFANVFKLLPFMQLTVLTRQAFFYELEAFTPLTHSMLSGEIANSSGFELWIGDTLIPPWGVALLAGCTTLALLVCLIVRFARIKKTD